ncbi:MAG TPA: RluA family pseudouridine synthase [Pirellulales bacterium]|nr:RluA family pseudouridine synthase [Pirellulales bacterium]
MSRLPKEPTIADRVLYEDNHLLALNKPAGLATMGVEAGRPSVWSLAKEYIKLKYRKPGGVYLGTVSRLDATVSGVVLFARTSKAAARLAEQFRARSIQKLYWAIVSGLPEPAAECVDWLVKDERRMRMCVAASAASQAQQASLSYRRVSETRAGWLLEIVLHSGRKHQIRVQLSHRGLPILGDRKYGSGAAFPSGIALHSRQLEFTHPTRHERLTLTAPVPPRWPNI